MRSSSYSQISYSRTSGQYGDDSFQYVVADANGGYDTGVIVVNQADTDNNGIPDAWETANSLSAPVDPDADADSDGLPNWAEYALRTDPNISDNLPNLTMTSAFLDVPLSLTDAPDPNT
jgi:hypothetical protein